MGEVDLRSKYYILNNTFQIAHSLMRSLSIKVYGKVQGVGFRFYTQKTARELGVSGYVKNERDGRVYIEAEAEKEIMDTFVEWLKKGPQWARVDEVNVQELPLQKFVSFSIR
jgi:acylphosphatase